MRPLRVAIGVSGGVDSAVSAWLLKRKGFDVFGIHMINWDTVEEGSSVCPRSKDEEDARRICSRLEIPFHTVNFVKEYWNEVFVKMVDNYRKGRTVVPDIQCNRSIKYEHLHDHAMNNLGADYVATGHYATNSYGDFQENAAAGGQIRLLKAADPLKDQTFFLCTLRQHQLKRAMFPLGKMLKPEVRRLATEHGFNEMADKPESMGICFVGKRKNFDNFMDQYIESQPGSIVTVDGRLLGSHSGIHHFTIGKRVHLQGSHLGYFVTHLDPVTQNVVVCEGTHNPLLYATEFEIEEPEWIADHALTESGSGLVDCRIQRTHPPVACVLKRVSEGRLSVRPRLPLRAVAPGQTCVFYHLNECLGGGEVQRVISTLADGK